MTDQGVAFPDEGQQQLELRTMNVLAGCFIGERLVEFEAFELAEFILVYGTDAQVSYLQALPCFRTGFFVEIGSLGFLILRQNTGIPILLIRKSV
jgi:hypothetical protein